MLVVTHDLGLAWNIADRIAVMYLGRIVEVGTTEEVLQRPQHPYTQALLSVVPEMDADRAESCSRARRPDPSRIPGGLPLPPALPGPAPTAARQAGVDATARRSPLDVLPAAGAARRLSPAG